MKSSALILLFLIGLFQSSLGREESTIRGAHKVRIARSPDGGGDEDGGGGEDDTPPGDEDETPYVPDPKPYTKPVVHPPVYKPAPVPAPSPVYPSYVSPYFSPYATAPDPSDPTPYSESDQHPGYKKSGLLYLYEKEDDGEYCTESCQYRAKGGPRSVNLLLSHGGTPGSDAGCVCYCPVPKKSRYYESYDLCSEKFPVDSDYYPGTEEEYSRRRRNSNYKPPAADYHHDQVVLENYPTPPAHSDPDVYAHGYYSANCDNFCKGQRKSYPVNMLGHPEAYLGGTCFGAFCVCSCSPGQLPMKYDKDTYQEFEAYRKTPASAHHPYYAPP